MGYSFNFLSCPCGTYSGGEMLFCKKYIIYLTVHNIQGERNSPSTKPQSVSTQSLLYTISSYKETTACKEMASGFIKHHVIKNLYLTSWLFASSWNWERGSSQHCETVSTAPELARGWLSCATGSKSQPWIHLLSASASDDTRAPFQQFQFCF